MPLLYFVRDVKSNFAVLPELPAYQGEKSSLQEMLYDAVSIRPNNKHKYWRSRRFASGQPSDLRLAKSGSTFSLEDRVAAAFRFIDNGRRDSKLNLSTGFRLTRYGQLTAHQFGAFLQAR